MKNKFRTTLLLGLACSVLGLASCGTSDDDTDTAKNTFNLVQFGNIDTTNPQLMNGTWDRIISTNVFEGLTALDNKGNVIPGLVKNWDTNDDVSEYTFHLRDGLKWSDGTPLTADDVVFTFQHLFDPKTASRYASLLYTIKNSTELVKGKVKPEALGVSAIDAKTIKFELTGPTAYFPALLTHEIGSIIPKHAVIKYGPNWSKAKNIVSEGAYTLKSFVPSGNVVLEKNPYYYDKENVHIKTINISQTTDLSTLMKEFIAGKVDYGNTYKTSQRDMIEKARPGTTHLSAYPGIWYMTFNLSMKRFQHADLRHAIGMAIDRQKILTSIESLSKPAYNFVPPGMGGISKSAKLYWRDWDMKKRSKTAHEILEKYGYNKKHPLEMEYETYNSEASRKLFVALSQNLKSYNVKLKLNVNETKTHYTMMENRQFESTFAGWVLDYNDAYDFLFLGSPKFGGANDYSGYNSPVFNSYLDLASKESDTKKRGDFLYQAEQTMLDDLPNIPLYYSLSANLVGTMLGGYEDNIMNSHPLKYFFYKKNHK